MGGTRQSEGRVMVNTSTGGGVNRRSADALETKRLGNVPCCVYPFVSKAETNALLGAA